MSDDLVKRLRVDDPWCQPKCADAADRIEELEAKLAKAEETLEKLARLGNGDRYGNSDGNMIARATLAILKGETDE